VLRWQFAIALFIPGLLLGLPSLQAQTQPPSDRLLVDATLAYTWTDGDVDIIQLQGPVNIRLDRMQLQADGAVIWLTAEPGLVIGQERATIALIGNASVKEPVRGITRSGDQLLVSVAVRGDILITAVQCVTGDQSQTPLYAQAAQLRAASAPTAASEEQPLQPITESPSGEAKTVYRTLPGASTRPTATFRIRAPGQIETVPSVDDTLTVALTGDVGIFRTSANGDFLSIYADRAVIFTHEKNRGAFQTLDAQNDLGRKISGAYLEGDVRITFTPRQSTKAEQRLTANRVYYDFDTDRAVLADVVLHSSDPTGQIPITIRAAELRQLSAGEYRGNNVELSSSSFATPTFSVKTDQVYVRQDEEISSYTGQVEGETGFVAQGNHLELLDAPVFYLPTATGSVDEDPFPLRTIDITHTGRLGSGVTTEFGLFESLGKPRPPGLDVSFLADYFSRRGPATGINAKYSGNNLNQDNNDLSDFSGQIKSFLITDHGSDEFGGDRSDVNPPDQVRGKFLFEHQQFLPDHWQAQIRLGYASDPTFLEEYYANDFYRNQPYDAVAYLKRQEDTEAITFLANADTNTFVTTADQQVDQFDVGRLPEAGYRRIGDSIAGDNLTFFSQNTADRLSFEESHASLDDQGFVDLTPGIPSEGYTGTQTTPVDRGDSRQEVDYPIQLGQIKMVPFAIGRATAYSDSPSADPKDRIYGAMGVRFSTDFWKVDNAAQSDLFDISRVRHVIEPEVNLYTSGETTNRDDLFIYDQDVDGITDISALDLALHQRWETYRGAPGKQKSVEFLALNISADAFTDPPKDAGLLPEKFRGLYFPSDPEASIPRDAINSDLTWHASDSTAILADSQYDVDHAELATASFGLATQRYDRMAYYLGLRYIQALNSDIGTFAVQYQLSTKYAFEFSQGYDFGQNQNTHSEFRLQRRFDIITAEFGVFHDSASGDSGVSFNLYPTGFGPTREAPDIGSYFQQ
jgi:hypothetical protein